jgi:NADPH:quinone reductase-like Zn-dependent oxidoreductase
MDVHSTRVQRHTEPVSPGRGDLRMKAAVFTRYGDPGVIRITEVPRPVPGDGEVLIAVRAASVNPLDGVTAGKPYTVRLMSGLRRPRITRLGVDVAGRMVAAGRDAARFKPGDDVFGFCLADVHAGGAGAWAHTRGAFAEYACVPETALAGKPGSITFEQAAATPVAAVTAWQGLHDKGRVQPGQHVLVNGAAGGVGTFAVQIAKCLGAEVTGVCSTRNVDMVTSIGADRVIDYTRADFTEGGRRYDVVFDCVGNRSLAGCRRVLTRSGVYVGAGAPPSRWMLRLAGRMIAILVLSRLVSQDLAVYLAKPRQEDLLRIRDLIAAGKITPVVDRCYGLADVAGAMRYQQGRHARGKVVISLGGAAPGGTETRP